MSDEDFPAAHSMDTEWYAIDRDGNIAHFTTGEAGAAPESALNHFVDSEADMSVDDAINHLAMQSGGHYEVDDLVAMPGGPVFNYAWRRGYETVSFTDAEACYSVLMLLSSEASLPELQPPRPGVIARMLRRETKPLTIHRLANSKHALGYVYGPLPVGTLQQWMQDGSVLKAWVNHSLSPVRTGLFEYEHGDVFENWIAGLYLREGVPTRPLNFSQLPEAIRRVLERTRFEKRSFARDLAIDPREAGACSSWNEDWVGLDGVIHRVRNDEDQLT